MISLVDQRCCLKCLVTQFEVMVEVEIVMMVLGLDKSFEQVIIAKLEMV